MSNNINIKFYRFGDKEPKNEQSCIVFIENYEMMNIMEYNKRFRCWQGEYEDRHCSDNDMWTPVLKRSDLEK